MLILNYFVTFLLSHCLFFEKLLSHLCSILTAQFLGRPCHSENCNFFLNFNQFYLFTVHCSHVRNVVMTILFCWLNGCLVDSCK